MIYFDQLKRPVYVKEPPQRIVCLVPSITELLVDLGLTKELVGLTKFCVHPKGIKEHKVIIGGTKNVDLEKVRSLKPDLIIANKEENEKKTVMALERDFPVWVSDVHDLLGAIYMIEGIGKVTGRRMEANKLSVEIKKRFTSQGPDLGSAVYLIWNRPLMTAGKDTFIIDMMYWAGLDNLIPGNRYPEITEKQLVAFNPDFLLLSTEPFPFDQGHVEYYQQLLRHTRVKLVDGEMFSWYGSRVIKAREYFVSLADY